MRALVKIEAELTEKRNLLASDAAIEDIDTLNTEVDALLQERAAALDAIEKRKKMLGSIAAGTTGTEVRTQVTIGVGANEGTNPDDMISSKEYRNAFYKSMTGRKMTAAEEHAYNTVVELRANISSADSSAGPAIPTQLNGDIVQKVKQIAPMLDEITLLRINGNVTIAVEGAIADAALHTENAAITADGDNLVKVALGSYEITKLITISKTVRTMAQGNFESWLVEMIAKRIARRIEGYIINGTGTNEPKGVAKAATWADGTNQVTVAKAASLTADNVNGLVALLNGEYDYNAKILMSKKTLFLDFMPLQDKGKNDVVRVEGKSYYVQGYPVLLSDSVALHDAYLGSFTEVYGNLSQDITVENNASSGFRQNAIDFLGSAMFDCTPAVGEAFVKLTKATT